MGAGDALGVSHAAISQQLRVLEEHLGTSVVDRSGSALRLTPAGSALAVATQTGFATIAKSVADITGARASRPVHVTTTPSFAAAWLMPRLPVFRALHPEIDLMIDPSATIVPLQADGAEVALRYGKGEWSGLDAALVLQSSMVVVAAPSLVGDGPVPDVAALAALPWLEEFGTTEATRWISQQGRPKLTGPRVQLPGNLLLDGARDGHGVAATGRALVERDIAAGRLRVLWADTNTETGYFVVTRPGILRPAVKSFVSWLRREGDAAS